MAITGRQPQGPTAVDWSNPIARGLVIAINFGDPDVHTRTLNIATGNVLTPFNSSLPEYGSGPHGRWVGRGNVSENYLIPDRQPVGCTIIALVNNFTVAGNRFIICSFNAPPTADNWVGFDTTPQPILYAAASPRVTGFGTRTRANMMIGFQFFSNDYKLFQDGNMVAASTGGGGNPLLSAIGATGAGYSTYSSRMYGLYVWDRKLAEGEHRAIGDNFWQLLRPSRRKLDAYGGVILEPRYGRPISDVSAGAWTPSSGGSLAAMLDETTASDADYISVASASTCEVQLTPLADPGTSNAHSLRIRMKSDDSSSARVSIRQGAGTEIAAWTQALTSTVTEYRFDLSGGQIDSITNYTDLRLRIEAL